MVLATSVKTSSNDSNNNNGTLLVSFVVVPVVTRSCPLSHTHHYNHSQEICDMSNERKNPLWRCYNDYILHIHPSPVVLIVLKSPDRCVCVCRSDEQSPIAAETAATVTTTK